MTNLEIMTNRKEIIEYYIYFITCNINLTFDEIKKEIEQIIDTNIGEEVVNDIIMGISSKVEELQNLRNEVDTDEERLMIDDDLIRIKNLLKDLSLCIKKYKEEKQEAEHLDNFSEDMILFAKNDYGNFMILKDLKEIRKSSKEQYNVFIKLIDMLKNGYSEFNKEKQRPLINNSDIKGLYELKEYQSRLIYRYVEGYAVIVGATIKKDDNSKKNREFLINCKEKSQNYVDSIKNEKVQIIDLISETADAYTELGGGSKDEYRRI